MDTKVHRKPKNFVIILIFIGFLVIPNLIISIRNIWQKNDIITQRQEELRKLEAENERLKQAIEEAKTPEFVEREARNKLGLAKPDEVVILMDKPEVSGQNESGLTSVPKGPKWIAWWRLFF